MTGVASGGLARTRSAATYTAGRAVDVAPLLYGVLLAEAVATELLVRTLPSARDIVGLVLVSCALLVALTAASAHTPHPAGTTR